MANEKTLNALKKIATFGTSLAAESAYNEFKTEKDTEKFENSLNQLLPDVMRDTNTNPNKMAAAYNVGGQARVTSNLDTTMQSTIDTAANYAAMDPGSYNKKLATDLLPSVQAIRSLKGAERSVAMKRFENQIQVAQAQQMSANKKYVQTQTRNVLSSNINTTLENSLGDIRSQSPQERAASFDDQLSSLLISTREKGLPDLDAQKLVSDVFLGRITEGRLEAETLLENSRFKAFVNPESLRVAQSKGQQARIDMEKAKKNSKLLSKDEEEDLLQLRLEKNAKAGKSGAQFILDNTDYTLGLSKDTFNEFIMAGADEVTLSNNPDQDAAVKATRDEIVNRIAAYRSQNIDAQTVKNLLNNRTSHLGSVVDAVYSNKQGDLAWAVFDKERTVPKNNQYDPNKESRINRGIKAVTDRIAERMDQHNEGWFQRKLSGVQDFFRWDVFGDSAYTRNVGEFDTAMERLRDKENDKPSNRVRGGEYDTRTIADMGRFEDLMGRRVDWSDPDDVDKFIDFTYRFDTLGGTTVYTSKDRETFSSEMGREEVDTYVKEIGLNIRDEFIKAFNPENPERYENILFGSDDADMITMEVYPNNDRMKIFINRFDSDLDRAAGYYTTQRIDGMFKFERTYGSEAAKPVLLSKEQYDYAMKSPVYRAQLEAEGWRHTTSDGAIEIDPKQLRAFAQHSITDKRLERDRQEKETIRQSGGTIIAGPLAVIPDNETPML